MSVPKKLLMSLGSIFILLVISCSPKSNNTNYVEAESNDNEKEEVIKTANGPTCGVERWAVKTGTDNEAKQTNLKKSMHTTIQALNNITAPEPDTIKNLPRQSPVETTVYVVDATLTQFRGENDSDYHLILSDNAGNVMIAEIPFPDCVGENSPYAAGIVASRKAFDAKYTVLPPLDPNGDPNPFQDANIPVRISGVGFFDVPHGQNGLAKNAIELHPVLNIEFNPENFKK
jgi:hypothetical protein